MYFISFLRRRFLVWSDLRSPTFQVTTHLLSLKSLTAHVTHAQKTSAQPFNENPPKTNFSRGILVLFKSYPGEEGVGGGGGGGQVAQQPGVVGVPVGGAAHVPAAAVLATHRQAAVTFGGEHGQLLGGVDAHAAPRRPPQRAHLLVQVQQPHARRTHFLS
jgi:hypothetical protein